MLRKAVLPPTVKPVLTAGDPQVSAAGCRLAIHDAKYFLTANWYGNQCQHNNSTWRLCDGVM